MWYDERSNVDTYLKMTEGYEDVIIQKLFKAYVPKGSAVLELGMGPGRDMDLLKGEYIVTGSDQSQIFLDLYKQKHPEADLLRLDAQTVATKLKFDCIYSNKVLHHLEKEQCITSLDNQVQCLKEGGLVVHTFWQGQGRENFDGLSFQYYTESALIKAFSPFFDLVASGCYTEEAEGDSIYVIGRKK